MENSSPSNTLRRPGSYGAAFQAWHFATLSPAAHVVVSFGLESFVASLAWTYLGWWLLSVKYTFFGGGGVGGVGEKKPERVSVCMAEKWGEMHRVEGRGMFHDGTARSAGVHRCRS